jgi:hypothetical protein
MNVFEAAPKRFECLHLHHPKSGRNPHRPLIFFAFTPALNHSLRKARQICYGEHRSAAS